MLTNDVALRYVGGDPTKIQEGVTYLSPTASTLIWMGEVLTLRLRYQCSLETYSDANVSMCPHGAVLELRIYRAFGEGRGGVARCHYKYGLS